MNIFLILFVIAILLAAVGGPVIDSTSGADIIDRIAVIISNVSGLAAIVFGIIGVVKIKKEVWLKVILIILVIIASVGSMIVADLIM